MLKMGHMEIVCWWGLAAFGVMQKRLWQHGGGFEPKSCEIFREVIGAVG